MYIIFISVLVMQIFVLVIFFTPKLRAKFMSHQLKASKYMMEQNEELLKELSTKSANLSKEGIKIKAGAVKEGFSVDSIYCKHCGFAIDSDSKFCKACGKRQ